MIQPAELQQERPMTLAGGVVSTTTQVWDVLVASKNGDLAEVKRLVNICPALIYAQYNYIPPIHLAVREGHLELVQYLLSHGAHDPDYQTDPFLDNLPAIARDRGFHAIAEALEEYAAHPERHKYQSDNGTIHYNLTPLQQEFEDTVDGEDILKAREMLAAHPELAKHDAYFWGEGILTFAPKTNNREMIDLLLSYGATFPSVLKWAQFYYFERLDGATYILEKGMSPNVMNWQHVTILHEMAQKGDLSMAWLLLQHGAKIDAIDEEYQSTPLGLAARWGEFDMVQYLLIQGADPNKAGTPWATPLAWAIKKEHPKIEETLRRAGAKH